MEIRANLALTQQPFMHSVQHSYMICIYKQLYYLSRQYEAQLLSKNSKSVGTEICPFNCPSNNLCCYVLTAYPLTAAMVGLVNVLTRAHCDKKLPM